MVNSTGFGKRLQIILNYYGISATDFSNQISVNRSTISHLLSGRNKPSLDFVMKVLEKFPEVELYWLLKGEGNFPKEENTNSTSFTLSEIKTMTFDLNEVSKDETIEKIILFYKNGTFKSFEP